MPASRSSYGTFAPSYYKGLGEELAEKGMWLHIPPILSFLMTPKQRWKAQQSAVRWERRYGKPKQFFTGEIGSYSGFKFITS